MTARASLTLALTCLITLISAGCSNLPNALSPTQAQANAAKSIDPQQVQTNTMNFAARYLVAMADVYDRVQNTSAYPEARQVALRCKLSAGLGAMSNAVNPNPIAGCMDMAVMTTLTRQSMEDPWAKEALGPENQTVVIETLKIQEAEIWNLAGTYLNPDQLKELRALTQRWRQEHPQQRYVGGARLADFPEAKQPNNPGLQLATSVFGLVRLDPFTGLDPAVRQVEESRILAERMFFYFQDMPTLLSWQTDLLYLQMLAQPQVVQFLKDTSTFSTNTTGFTQATAQFADASSHFAQTIETFRTQLPEQQSTLVKQVNDIATTQRDAALKQANADITTLLDTTTKQLNELVATQRDAALKQAAAEITTQRDAALKQLDATASTQQQLMAKNLQGVLDNSIDQLYHRLRSLILIAAAALLAVLLIHRLSARLRSPEKPHA